MIKEDSDLQQFLEEGGLGEEEVLKTLQISIKELEKVLISLNNFKTNLFSVLY
jgi:hypothetical protein